MTWELLARAAGVCLGLVLLWAFFRAFLRDAGGVSRHGACQDADAGQPAAARWPGSGTHDGGHQGD